MGRASKGHRKISTSFRCCKMLRKRIGEVSKCLCIRDRQEVQAGQAEAGQAPQPQQISSLSSSPTRLHLAFLLPFSFLLIDTHFRVGIVFVCPVSMSSFPGEGKLTTLTDGQGDEAEDLLVEVFRNGALTKYQNGSVALG